MNEPHAGLRDTFFMNLSVSNTASGPALLGNLCGKFLD
jgi:hypothetical protein